MGVSAKLRMRSTGFSWESKSKVRPKKKKIRPFRPAKQLVIRVRRKKISALILIAYRHPYLQREQCSLCSLYVHVGHARRIISWYRKLLSWHTCVFAIYCETEVRSSSVSEVVRLRIVFSKAALQKRSSIEPMEPPLDPPLVCTPSTVAFTVHWK